MRLWLFGDRFDAKGMLKIRRKHLYICPKKCFKLFFLYLQVFIMLALCGMEHEQRLLAQHSDKHIFSERYFIKHCKSYTFVYIYILRSRLSSEAGLLRDKSHGRTTRINIGHERCLKAERSFPFLIS